MDWRQAILLLTWQSDSGGSQMGSVSPHVQIDVEVSCAVSSVHSSVQGEHKFDSCWSHVQGCVSAWLFDCWSKKMDMAKPDYHCFIKLAWFWNFMGGAFITIHLDFCSCAFTVSDCIAKLLLDLPLSSFGLIQRSDIMTQIIHWCILTSET